MIQFHAMRIDSIDEKNLITQTQDIITIISTLQDSIDQDNKVLFGKFLHAYVSLCGYIVEKQAGLFGVYTIQYIMTSFASKPVFGPGSSKQRLAGHLIPVGENTKKAPGISISALVSMLAGDPDCRN